MQSSAPELFDLSANPRPRASSTAWTTSSPKISAAAALLARRMLERGVRFVQVWSGPAGATKNWDNHGQHPDRTAVHGQPDRPPDRGAGEDLKSRGLLDDTLIIWTTEFGPHAVFTGPERPRSQRRHLRHLLAGAGLKPGIAHGKATSGRGKRKRRFTATTLHATILHLLGIRSHQAHLRHNGSIGGSPTSMVRSCGKYWHKCFFFRELSFCPFLLGVRARVVKLHRHKRGMNMRRKVRASLGGVVVEALEGRLFLSGIGSDPPDTADAGPPVSMPRSMAPSPRHHPLRRQCPRPAPPPAAPSPSPSAPAISQRHRRHLYGTVHFTALTARRCSPPTSNSSRLRLILGNAQAAGFAENHCDRHPHCLESPARAARSPSPPPPRRTTPSARHPVRPRAPPFRSPSPRWTNSTTPQPVRRHGPFQQQRRNATLPANSTLTNGAGTFSGTLRTAGAQTMTAADSANGSIAGTSNADQMSRGGGDSLHRKRPSQRQPRAPRSTSPLTAQESVQQHATEYAGTVHFTTSDSNFLLPVNSTLTNGAGTFSARLRTPGIERSPRPMPPTDPITGYEHAITVTRGGIPKPPRR